MLEKLFRASKCAIAHAIPARSPQNPFTVNSQRRDFGMFEQILDITDYYEQVPHFEALKKFLERK